jgi:hypothetical protein
MADVLKKGLMRWGGYLYFRKVSCLSYNILYLLMLLYSGKMDNDNVRFVDVSMHFKVSGCTF